jgi:hemerythrin
MTFFQWDEQLDVGVGAMNDEHKELISLMNRLHERNLAGASKTELLKAIKDLAQFTVKHFTDEEAFMESIQFPGLETHRLIHKDLLQKFTKQAADFEHGSAMKVPESMFTFLRVWLSAHIRGIDCKYGKHAEGRAA